MLLMLLPERGVCKCRQVLLFLGRESFDPAEMDRLWALLAILGSRS